MDDASPPSEPLDLTTPTCRARHACATSHAQSKGAAETLLVETELEDVRAFLAGHEANSGVLDLLNEYLVWLARRSESKW